MHLCLNRARLFGSLGKLLFLKKRSWTLRTISSQFPVSSTPSSHGASGPHACAPLFATLFFPSHEPREYSVGLKAESRVHECGQPGLVAFLSHEQPLVRQGPPHMCFSWGSKRERDNMRKQWTGVGSTKPHFKKHPTAPGVSATISLRNE